MSAALAGVALKWAGRRAASPPLVNVEVVLTPEELGRRSAGWDEVNKGLTRMGRAANHGVDEERGDLATAGGTPPEEFWARCALLLTSTGFAG